jgi:hypothetical protein
MLIKEGDILSMLVVYLRDYAERIQAGKAEPPLAADNANSDLHLQQLRANLAALQAVPDRKIVAAAIANLESEIRQIEGPAEQHVFLCGTSHQLLTQPEAADLGYWKAFVSVDGVELGIRLSRLVESLEIGYASEADRPARVLRNTRHGRRPAALKGSVELLKTNLR